MLGVLLGLSAFAFAPFLTMKSGYVTIMVWTFLIFVFALAGLGLDASSIDSTLEFCRTGTCPDDSPFMEGFQCECSLNIWYWFMLGIDIAVVLMSILTCIFFLGGLLRGVPDAMEANEMYYHDLKKKGMASSDEVAVNRYDEEREMNGDEYGNQDEYANQGGYSNQGEYYANQDEQGMFTGEYPEKGSPVQS